MRKADSRMPVLPYLCVLTMVLAMAVAVFGQELVPATKSYVKLGEDFLHALYPDLNNKKYTITVETSVHYDDEADIPRAFRMDVGDGPKSLVLSCCFGGYAGGSMSLKLPDPIEWGPPSPPPCPPAPSCPLYATPRYPMRPKNVDAEGQLRPEQFLTGFFSFDADGRLLAFSAQGSATTNHEADNQLYEALRSGRHLTDNEIAKFVKDSGARYGFKDQKRFRDELPIKEIERFIGKTKVISVDFEPINLTSNSDLVNELGVWSNAIVFMQATQTDGKKLRYRAFFDHFRGSLTSLNEWPDNQPRW